MYCSKCGKEVLNQSVFCGNCGSVIEASQKSTQDINSEGHSDTQKEKNVMVSFCTKKQFGQFLVSNVILEIGSQQYRVPFNVTTKINVPEGLQSITCYMDYLGKSGIVKIQSVFSTGRLYQIVYTTPIVVTSPGNMTIS